MLHYFIEIDHIVAKYYLGPTLVPPADVSPPYYCYFCRRQSPMAISQPFLVGLMPTLVPPITVISADVSHPLPTLVPLYYCYFCRRQSLMAISQPFLLQILSTLVPPCRRQSPLPCRRFSPCRRQSPLFLPTLVPPVDVSPNLFADVRPVDFIPLTVFIYVSKKCSGLSLKHSQNWLFLNQRQSFYY